MHRDMTRKVRGEHNVVEGWCMSLKGIKWDLEEGCVQFADEREESAIFEVRGGRGKREGILCIIFGACEPAVGVQKTARRRNRET
jgi:hypothetical protein